MVKISKTAALLLFILCIETLEPALADGHDSRMQADLEALMSQMAGQVGELISRGIYTGPKGETLFFDHLQRGLEQMKSDAQQMTDDEVNGALQRMNQEGLASETLSPREMMSAVLDQSTEIRLSVAKEIASIPSGPNRVNQFLMGAQQKLLNRNITINTWSLMAYLAMLGAILLYFQLVPFYVVLYTLIIAMPTLGFITPFTNHLLLRHRTVNRNVETLVKGSWITFEPRMFDATEWVFVMKQIKEEIGQFRAMINGISSDELRHKSATLMEHYNEIESQLNSLYTAGDAHAADAGNSLEFHQLNVENKIALDAIKKRLLIPDTKTDSK